MASKSPETPERVLPVDEARRRLGISPRSFWTLLALERIPKVQVTARRVGVLESDLVAYMRQQRKS